MCLSLAGGVGAGCGLSGFLGRVKRRIHPLFGRHAETAGINPGGSLALVVGRNEETFDYPPVAPLRNGWDLSNSLAQIGCRAGPPAGNTLR